MPSAISRFAAASSFLLLAVSLHAAEPATPKYPWDADPRLPESVTQSLQDRDYDAAIKAIDALIKADADKKYERPRLLYVRGRTYYLAGKYDEAIGQFTAVEQQYAESVWADRARFARGVTLAKKGDFASARLVYRNEAVKLLSPERKQELADVYLEFAKKYSTPFTESSPPDQTPPDFGKAIEFYRQALELGPKPQLRADVEFQIADCFRLAGNPSEAAAHFQRFIKTYVDDPRVSEARYRLGEAQLLQGQHVDARQTWQDLLAAWPGDRNPPGKDGRAVLANAAYRIAETYHMPNPPSDDDLLLGVAALENYLKRFGDHVRADEARRWIIAARAARGRFAEAVAAAEAYLADPKRAAADEAAEVRNLLGLSLRQQKKFTEAIAAWRDFLVKHPAHAAWNQVQQQIIETEFLIGFEAYDRKRFEDARTAWTDFLVRYPLDPRSPQILLYFGRMEFDAEKYDAAMAEWRRLVSKYPGSEPASQAQLLIGLTFEEKLGKPLEAIREYRKLNWGSRAGEAQTRIAALTAKQLQVTTERIFRTDEPAKIRLNTRNVDRVTVRIYAVDLETYFRKMHLARGVESLDLALIDPDRSFEFTVPDYAEYKPLESDVVLDLIDEKEKKKPATPAVVWAVTVASKTLEATTLVLRSDLDMIVKSSRDETFVYAQNMRTGKSWDGVQVLLSNGSEIFAEGKTGADGVFRHSSKKLHSHNDVRVFAVVDGSTASNVVGLNGVGVAQGLQERGYVYTDRSVYLPGQPVHIRGVIRGVANDQFVVPAKKKYRLDVFDARNRVIHNVDVVTGDFGSFHAFFTLPESAPPGDYRVAASDIDGRTYAGPFRVEHYRLDPVQLTIDVPRTTYYRGEEIEGSIIAKYSYGTPLAGREVRYTFSDGRTHTATTDAEGKVAFKLPTREFRESQGLQLVAELPERNLRAISNFLLAVRGFSIGITTVRGIVTAGETFEATLKTNSADGKPTAEKLKLHVLERTVIDGRPGEREVEVRDLATNEKEGVGRTTFNLEKGGHYLLRAEGTDRFGNPIAATHEVFVSDDSDSVRLRILADRHTYQLDDEADVRVHWREAPALALVTFQGARILDYRLVRLTTGDNRLKLPLGMKLAPNFRLEISVMTDVREAAIAAAKKTKKPTPRSFHTASSDFTVERALKVTLTPKRRDGKAGQPEPGETIDVEISAVDPQGKPVLAEIGLGLIDRASFDRFGTRHEPLEQAFRGQTREPAVRTTASISFAYRPTTRPINVRLLSEEERLAMAELEQAARRQVVVHNGTFSDDAQQENGQAALYMRNAEEKAKSLDKALGDVDQSLRAAVDGVSSNEIQGFGFLSNQAGGMGGGGGFPAGGPVPVTMPQSAARESNASKKAGDYRAFNGPADRPAEAGEKSEALAALEERASDRKQLEKQGAGKWQLGVDLARDGEGRLSEGDVRNFVRNGGRELTIVTNGIQLNRGFFNVDSDSDEAVSAVWREIESDGAVLLSPSNLQETAYWNPAIVTDAAGKATVAVTLPERSASWKLLAKGITVETLAGEGSGELTVKKDLFAEVRVPSVLTDGDTATIEVAVHDERRVAGKPSPIDVIVKTTIGRKTTTETKRIEKAGGLQEISFPLAAALPSEADRADKNPAANELIQVEVTLKADRGGDVVRRVVSLRPYGYPIFAGAAGTATGDATAWVEAPAGVDLQQPRLEIVVGGAVDRDLLDVVLAGPTWCDHARRYAGPLETTTSDLLAALALQKLLAQTRDKAGPESKSLDARIRSAVGSLMSSQVDDGGWSWTGAGGSSNRFASARVMWALSRARAAGYTVAADSFDKAVNYLSAQQTAVPDDDFEGKAVILHALSESGHGDFAVANRLYRSRTTLSEAAAAYLSLALIKLDHVPMAADLATSVVARTPAEAKAVPAGVGEASYNSAVTEIRALLGLALSSAAPGATQLPKIVELLQAERSGNRWSPEKATGPAVMLLAEWYGKHKPGGEKYKLIVVVNNREQATLDVDPAAAPHTIAVDPKALVKGKQHIQFKMTGRGHLTYRCTLGGFVAADKLKSSMPAWYVERTYEPANREHDGRDLPRGMSIVEGSYSSIRNPLTQLPAGRRGHVQLNFWRRTGGESRFDDRLDYLIVREPLPAGTEVVETSLSGSYERYEILPGEVLFYVGNRRGGGSIHFEVVGQTTGAYRAAPTQLANAHRLEQAAFAKPAKLDVIPRNQPSVDEYKWSADELFALGKSSYEKRNWAGARTYLTEMLGKWTLRTQPYQETLRMLLDAHLELGPQADVVKYFELVKEKSPELEIPFEKILKVGEAYHELGEYERSYLVFRATVESSFARDGAVAGFLEAQGEFVRSVAVMRRLFAEYPPEPYVAAAEYALAQNAFAFAPQAATDARLREAKLTKVDLVHAAERMLDDFLTAYPDDPAADEAAFAQANALLELEFYDRAVARCEAFVKRYPKSDFVDSYLYVIGYCHFAAGRPEQALETCRRVAEMKRTDPATGRTTEARNKQRAIYILGQVYHSLGKAAEAIREYARVADQIPDAKQAIDYFSRREITLPEVTTIRPGQPATVKLKHRNVATVDVKAYRIDLMKFSLLRQNLSELTKINLAGIRPLHETTIDLGDGKDYRDRERDLALPLKEEGAYFVVARGENLHTGGFVVVTPLAVEVQEDAVSGTVRATVKDVIAEKYAADVHVKVIGSRDGDFKAGETDLRGVFVAEPVAGNSTVIAQVDDDRYAFFRGTTDLLPQTRQPAKQNQPAQQAKPSSGQSQQQGKGYLLDQLRQDNDGNSLRQQELLRNNYYNNRNSGVKVKEAY